MAANRDSNYVPNPYYRDLLRFTKADLVEIVWDYAKISLGDESRPNAEVMAECVERRRILAHLKLKTR